MELIHTHVVGCFETRATPLDNPQANVAEVVWDDDGDRETGVVVNAATAKTLAAFWQALNAISGDVAQLPLKVYQRTGAGKDEAIGHPTYRLLHRRPCPELGPFQFKQLMTMRCLSWGNAYAFIERLGGSVAAMWPMESERVTPFRRDGVLYYTYQTEKGEQQVLDASEVFHLRGPGDDGLAGASVVKLARDSLAVGMQAQKYGARYFANDAKPGIVLEFPEPMKKEAAENILKNWAKRHGGTKNAGKPAFLDSGGKVSSFGVSNDDAQFLQTREFSRSEIASWLNVPPHRVGDMTHATFSNIEQQSIDYVTYSLMPWLVRWQDECNAKLFATNEVDSYYAEFVVDALLRGDAVSQMTALTQGLAWGVYNHDEVRSMKNLNPIPAGNGQKHFVPLNMAPIDNLPDPTQAQKPAPASDAPGGGAAGQKARTAGMLRTCAEIARVYRKVGSDAKRCAKSPSMLEKWRAEGSVRIVEKEADGFCRELATPIDKRSMLEVVRQDVLRVLRGAEDFNNGIETLAETVERLTMAAAELRPAEIAAQLYEVN